MMNRRRFVQMLAGLPLLPAALCAPPLLKATIPLSSGYGKLTVSQGLAGYNLDAAAKELVPLMSPFRQSIERRGAGRPVRFERTQRMIE